MSQTKETIADRLRSVRGALGVGEFADELGVNRKTVTRWEAGDAVPDGDSLLALQQVFLVDPVWLLLGEAVVGTRESEAQYIIRDAVDRAARGEPAISGLAQVLRGIADAESRRVDRAAVMQEASNYLSGLDDAAFGAALDMLMRYGVLPPDDRRVVNRLVASLGALPPSE